MYLIHASINLRLTFKEGSTVKITYSPMEKQRKGQLDPSFTLLTVHIISKKLAYVHTMILLPQLFFIKLK